MGMIVLKSGKRGQKAIRLRYNLEDGSVYWPDRDSWDPAYQWVMYLTPWQVRKLRPLLDDYGKCLWAYDSNPRMGWSRAILVDSRLELF